VRPGGYFTKVLWFKFLSCAGPVPNFKPPPASQIIFGSVRNSKVRWRLVGRGWIPRCKDAEKGEAFQPTISIAPITRGLRFSRGANEWFLWGGQGQWDLWHWRCVFPLAVLLLRRRPRSDCCQCCSLPSSQPNRTPMQGSREILETRNAIFSLPVVLNTRNKFYTMMDVSPKASRCVGRGTRKSCCGMNGAGKQDNCMQRKGGWLYFQPVDVFQVDVDNR